MGEEVRGPGPMFYINVKCKCDIYIYIYIQREREREICIYIYILDILDIYTDIITITASGKRQDHLLAAVLGK